MINELWWCYQNHIAVSIHISKDWFEPVLSPSYAGILQYLIREIVFVVIER